MFKFVKKIPVSVRVFLKAVFISMIVLASCGPVSCRATEEGIILVSDSYSCPKIEDLCYRRKVCAYCF
ncbi:MAG: hypothetical protein L6V86_03560 [Treponema sp.]|nr:MAG: hypothetical protein L6V86_03560 [Treponema sp.]